MKESPISEERKKLRHQIGVYTEAVFMHSIALGSGKTHQEAADRIMELVEPYAQKKYQEGELNGRIDELEDLAGFFGESYTNETKAYEECNARISNLRSQLRSIKDPQGRKERKNSNMSTQEKEEFLTLETKQLVEISLYMYGQWQEAMKPPLFAYYDFPTWLRRLHSTNNSLEEK